MAQVGEVSVVATIDTSRYKRGAREIEAANKGIEGSTDGADNSLGKLNKRLSGMARTGLKVATGGMIALGAAIATMTVKGGISRALNIEDAQAKLKGLGHDAESVTTIMESALDSVRGTAYGLDAAATIAASAVAAGVKPGQQLTKYLGTTADAATIAGVSLSEMGSIFNKVQTQQKVYTQELNQLADRGIPIYQWLQEELGVTQKALRDMVAAGEVDSETYFKVIQKNIGGAALESGKTTRGAWQNLLAAMSRVGERIVKGPIDRVRTGFGDMTKWVDNNSDRIVSAVQGTLDVVVQFGKGVVAVARLIYDMRVPIIAVTAAWAGYRVAILASNATMTIQAALLAAQQTRFMVLNGALVAVRTSTVSQTAAQAALNTVMKLNPIGLVVGALTALGTALYMTTQSSGRAMSATAQLGLARERLRVATDNLKVAEDNLVGAQLSAEGAALRTARAEQTLRETIQMYGKDSLEAKEATYALKQAKEDQRIANEGLQKAEANVRDAVRDNIKASNDLRVANETKNRPALQGYRGDWNSLKGEIEGTNSILDRINGKKVSFSVQGNTAPGPMNNETAAALGYRRYHGGPVSAGRAYLVGENRDGSINDTTELFVPNSSGRIVSSKDLQAAIGDVGGGGITNNIQNITIASEVDGERWLRRLNGNQEIVSNGLVPTQSYM